MKIIVDLNRYETYESFIHRHGIVQYNKGTSGRSGKECVTLNKAKRLKKKGLIRSGVAPMYKQLLNKMIIDGRVQTMYFPELKLKMVIK